MSGRREHLVNQLERDPRKNEGNFQKLSPPQQRKKKREKEGDERGGGGKRRKRKKRKKKGKLN